MKDIDERNKKLVALKSTKGNTEATLTNLKADLLKEEKLYRESQ